MTTAVLSLAPRHYWCTRAIFHGGGLTLSTSKSVLQCGDEYLGNMARGFVPPEAKCIFTQISAHTALKDSPYSWHTSLGIHINMPAGANGGSRVAIQSKCWPGKGLVETMSSKGKLTNSEIGSKIAFTGTKTVRGTRR